jgi:hypothetical protein
LDGSAALGADPGPCFNSARYAQLPLIRRLFHPGAKPTRPQAEPEQEKGGQADGQEGGQADGQEGGQEDREKAGQEDREKAGQAGREESREERCPEGSQAGRQEADGEAPGQEERP